MSFSLKKLSQTAEQTKYEVSLAERLPFWVNTPCDLSCVFHLSSVGQEYLLSLSMRVKTNLCCQVCLKEVPYEESYSLEILICQTDARANDLMSSFDCVVIEHDSLNLDDILVDELYFSLPQVPHTCD